MTGGLLQPRLRWLVSAVAAVLLAQGCASAPPPPKPPPSDPAAEETVAALTQALNLDAAQQKRARELLKEMADRDDAIRVGWSNGKPMKPMEILSSHGLFERDFFMTLTAEQKRLFVENKARLSARAR